MQHCHNCLVQVGNCGQFELVCHIPPEKGRAFTKEGLFIYAIKEETHKVKWIYPGCL